MLRVEGLCLGSDSRALVRDVGFELAEGRITCLIGPSGCGKTSVIKWLAGVLPAEISAEGRAELDGALKVVHGLGKTLPRQTVHEVEIDIVESGLAGQRIGVLRSTGGVDTAELPQLGIIETLHPDRQAVDPATAITGEVCGIGGAGVGLERDLGVIGDIQTLTQRRHDAGDGLTTEQAWGAAAEKHRLHAWPLSPALQFEIEIANQGIDITLLVGLSGV